MFKALSRESGFAMSGVPSHADIGSLPLSSTKAVAFTSVVTETIRPTLIITEVTTVGSWQPETSLSAGQQQSEQSSGQTVQTGTVQTNASQRSQTQTVQLAMSTASQLTDLPPETTPWAAASLTATVMTTPTWSTDDSASSSLPAGQPSVSLPPVVGHSLADSLTSSSELVVLSTSASAASPTTTSALTSTASSIATASSGLGVTSTTSTSTPTSFGTLVTSSLVETISTSVSSQSSTLALSPSPSSSSIEGIISGSDSTSGQTSQRKSASHVGAIVGGTIGGAVFAVLALLVGILCLRRRRRQAPIKPRGSPGRGLLRNSSDSQTSLRGPHGWHSQHSRQCSFPMGPIFSPRGNTMPSAPAPNSSGAAFNQGRSTMALHDDAQKNPFSDPEHSPVSPIINVHPPSRTASNYSQPSSEGGLKYLEKYDLHPTTPSSHYESIYYPDEGAFTPSLPEVDKLAPRVDRRTRLSTRSDPFDLEVPEKALQEWPLPHHPTLWGHKF